MCGITGMFNLDGRPASSPILKAMTDVIKHRGPDGEDQWIDGKIGLGHRRLAIIDLSPRGRQPMQTENGRYVMTYNGEVYNFQQIRVELQANGYQFRSQTDSEVVLKAWDAWGMDCVKRFNGMFAFAIWDKKEQTLFLARDRYGVKPLYYYHNGNTFLFGSEIKSILKHPEVNVEVNIQALNEYFSFQNIFSDLTLFDKIKVLKPAHVMSIRVNSPVVIGMHKYWDYNFTDDFSMSEDEYREAFQESFERSINRQLISDVEVGSYLSGGIDSGAVTCVSARNFSNLKTFTCGFDMSSASGLEMACDERQKAEYLSYLYKTEHYEVVLKAGDMERVMEDLVWHLEDLRVGQSYPNYYVSRLASKFVKVVMSGTGGDELFAGYPWRYYRAVVNESPDDYMNKYYQYWQRLIPDSFKSQFYQPEIYPEIKAYQTKDVFRQVMNGKALDVVTPQDYVNRSLYFEAKTFLPGLLTVEDKLSMAHGLETRVPFLDNDLVDLAMRTPVNYKLRDLGEVVRLNENSVAKSGQYYQKTNDGKIILRNALSRYVPENYAKGMKQGFSAPDGTWFKGESIQYIKDMLFDKRARIYDYIQPETTHKLLNEHFSGKQNRRLMIWSLLCFETWLKVFK